MATSRGIEWLAGLLEGEGCFTRQKGPTGTTTPLIAIGMTDRDVIETAVVLMEEIGGRKMTTRRRPLPSGKTAYQTSVTGLPAAKVMWLVLPFMGERRSRDIQRILAEWSPRIYRAAVAFHAEITDVQGVL